MRILLWPLAKLFEGVIFIRNFFFEIGILKQKTYDFPIICVGNLKTGGTGKSPLVFYISKILQDSQKVTILSRGYGRSTKGFRIVNAKDAASEVGDEPLQYAQFLQNINVAVCESRVEGIEAITKNSGKPEVLILDDAYQHRYVKAGFNILLTEYNDLYVHDEILPAGRLREGPSAAKRAHCVIVTKCPASLSENEMTVIKSELKLLEFQKIFFSTIRYREILSIENGDGITLAELKNHNIFLLTGIANPNPLKTFLQDYCLSIDELTFPDHHAYSVADMVQLRRKFDMFAKSTGNVPSYIITTRKDDMRLQKPEIKMLIKDLPIVIIDIDIDFLGNKANEFNQLIQHYVESN